MPSCFFSGKKINTHSVGALDEGFFILKVPKDLKALKVPKALKVLKDLKENFFKKIFAEKIKKF